MSGPVDAIVVAAGTSERMAGRDKLSELVLGRPLLAWAVKALDVDDLVDRLIVVAPPERLRWLDDEPLLRERVEVISGGARRQQSVAAGVRASSASTVLVHDGARPLATPELARRVAEAAMTDGAAIPIVPLAETVKRLAGDRIVGTVARDDLATAQTPQGFRRALLEQAWSAFAPDGAETWTDEAALLEAAGIPVRAVRGEVDNLKVTVAEDLVRVERLLAARSGGARKEAEGLIRTGFGRDSHPFGPGDGLALGGILIADAPALFGHSDGDAAVHAVADALLGAAALGDIGRLFPAGDPATRGAPSASLLEGVLERLAAAGYTPRGVDITIVGARPRLGAERLEAMRAAIAAILGLDPVHVSVKASTGNLSGDEGAGRVIGARAVATVAERAAEGASERSSERASP